MSTTPRDIKITTTIDRNDLFNNHCTGINFTGLMVNAILDGLKTHTCRKSNENRINDFPEGKIYYVRETVLYHPETKEKVYTADLNEETGEIKTYKENGFINKSSYYVPRELARIAILIKERRHTLIQHLNHDERVAEGLKTKIIDWEKMYYDYNLHFYKFSVKRIGEEKASLESFRTLWIKVHNINDWYDNGIVWSFYFEPLLIV